MSEAEQVVNQKTQTKKEEPQEERQYEARPKNTTKLQIRNLQFGTSKEDLHDLCRRFGTIVNCEVNKGNGFVTYAKADEAQLALSQLDALSFRGYTLRVQFAREPLPSKDKKSAEATPTTTTTTTTATTTTPTTTAGQKPEAKKEEKKLTFAQQQQLAKAKPQAPKQTFTQPAETPKVEQTQNNNNNNQGKGQQQQQQGQQGQGKKKGQQNKQQQQQQQQAEAAKKNELRTYKVSVEKTVLQEGDKKEEGFTFSVNHQQYLDYIIPLLKDIQSKKEQEKGSK